MQVLPISINVLKGWTLIEAIDFYYFKIWHANTEIVGKYI